MGSMRTFVTEDGRTDGRCWIHKDSGRVLTSNLEVGLAKQLMDNNGQERKKERQKERKKERKTVSTQGSNHESY